MNSNRPIAPQPNRRILIVDDNRTIHDDFRKILDGGPDLDGLHDAEALLLGEVRPRPVGHGFELEAVLQGRDGWERVQQAQNEGRPFAMAFVDMRMPPGWDGVETISKLWEVCPDLQVVLCTAFADYSWDEVIARLGQTDRLVILKKPFDVVEVLQLANALIAKWQLQQQVGWQVRELEQRIAERTRELEGANATLKTEIADRNKVEIQLRHAQKLESIGQLAAGIAHEINTPMQYIGDNTRFLQDAFGELRRVIGAFQELTTRLRDQPAMAQALSPVEAVLRAADVDYLIAEIPRAIEQSLLGAERVTKIVRAMKDFSHPGTGVPTPTNLNQAIESTITVARNEWKYVADLATDFDPQLPPVPCLPGEFNQVILNLIINAAHAIADVVGQNSGANGRITISTRRLGDWAEIRLADTGTGIPEAVRERVFDPFFTTKPVGKGTGQGLAIARSVIVVKHRGTLNFETILGRGTTFIIRLPLIAGDATPPRQ